MGEHVLGRAPTEKWIESVLAETAKDHLLVYLDRKKPTNISKEEPTSREVSG